MGSRGHGHWLTFNCTNAEALWEFGKVSEQEMRRAACRERESGREMNKWPPCIWVMFWFVTLISQG